ncbi:MAG: S8 family serine peptidase, partial [candidate division WOR-3 bacterium]
MTELLDTVRLGQGMQEPVRQVSGSFGTSVSLGYYRLEEASLDAVCWQDKWFFVTWAAGNFGQGTYNIGHPACAKNCLTVGATGNGTASNTMARSSSGGPTRDGRIKPNVVAPGDGVNTASGPEPSRYVLTSGTSFAAPAVSGAMVLVRQYFKEGWYPTGTPDSSRAISLLSSAMMRALAITSADSNVSTELPPARLSGWGRVNLSGILHFAEDSMQLAVVDETVGLGTGEYYEYRLEVERRLPLLVTLAWTDTAAAPGAAVAIVNDLDLELESPDRNRYRGNRFYEGQSIPNPATSDTLNVEEVCRLAYPMAGTWTVRVYARNVFNSRQPFALVVRQGTTPPPAVAEEVGTLRKTRTSIIGSWPWILATGLEQELTVFGSDGRLRARARVKGPWSGEDERGQRLESGVYYYRLRASGSGSAADKGKLVIVR